MDGDDEGGGEAAPLDALYLHLKCLPGTHTASEHSYPSNLLIMKIS